MAVAIFGVALAAYAVTFLVSAALVLLILGMAIAAAGIWFFIRGGHHAEATP
jgi:hypothetical protein